MAGFSFTFTSQQGVDFDNAVIRIELHITVEAKRTDDSLPNEPIGGIQTETFFRVDNLRELITQQPDGSSALPEIVGATALGLAFSTTRGILITLSGDSILKQAFLPVINPLQLLRSSQLEQSNSPAVK